MFNGVFSAVFNFDASVQAFAADLNSSDISSNDDFIQYPNKADNQTYQNAILHNKSIPLSFAIEEDETQQRVDSTSDLLNTSIQSGTLASGEQAETVVTSQGLLSEEFPEPEMDRPWFCSAYAAAGYFMCDPQTNIPKWCTYNLADIWCPDDPGFEYDPVTGGGGGSSGGAGASRTWENDKCFTSSMKPVNCKKQVLMGNFHAWDGGGDKVYKELDGSVVCYSADGKPISCTQYNSIGQLINPKLKLPDGTYEDWIGHISFGECSVYDHYGTSGHYWSPCTFTGITLGDNYEPFQKGTIITSDLRIVDRGTGLPPENPKLENGFPIPIPTPVPDSDPFNPEYPVTENECASIICQCISFVVKALEKVDQSILQVVAAVQALSFEVPTPSPFDISPVTDRLDSILTAIDNITIEMVKEAETNIWDFLGDTIKELNDLVQYIIDQLIYLIVPEDTDFLRENFSMLREAMSMKLEPVNMLKTQITASLMTEQQNFENIEMNLPIYGRVEFLNVEFLNYAVPKIRALISGIMIIVTSVWAYRKITSDMVR